MERKIVWAICACAAFGLLSACNRDHIDSVNALNTCVEFHSKKMFPQAIRDCNKAVSLDSENVEAYHSLAMIYFETKEFAQAARELQKAIAIAPNVAIYHYRLGEAFEWTDKWAEAEPEYKRAIELDDTLYKAHYHLGRVLEELDRPEEAMQKYTDALMRNGKFADAYRELGLLYIAYGFLGQADQVFREGIKALEGRSDEVGEMYQWLGQVLIEKKEYEAAIQELKKGLELKPDMVDAMFNLGWAYSFTNKENAKIWLEKFVASANQKTRQDYLSAASARLAELSEGAVIQ